MKREDTERMLERLLDGALAPQKVEPRPGLEERILANLKAQPEPRPWSRWLWAPAALAAIVLVAVAVRVSSHRPQPVGPPVAAPRQAAQPAVAPVAAPATVRAMARRKPPLHLAVKVTMTAELPRLDTFPSRTAVTPQEELLRAFVRRQLREAQAVAEAQTAQQKKIQTYFDTGELARDGDGGR